MAGAADHAPPGVDVFLVTGCTAGGIGWHLCAELAALGPRRARVYATARRAAAMAGLAERGCRLLELDVTDAGSVGAAVKAVLDEAGRIDVLVNNAGVAIRKPVLDFTPAEVRTLFDVNYHGVVAMCDAVLPAMVARRAGRVFNVGSGLGYATVPCMGHYGATKAALLHLTEMQRVELAPFGVRVCYVAPGYIKTHIADDDHHLPRGSAYHALPAFARLVARSPFLGVSFEGATPVGPFAKRLARAVAAPAPPRHWRGGCLWWFPWIVSMVVPLWVTDWGYAAWCGLWPGALARTRD